MKNVEKITDNRYRKLSDSQLVYSFLQHNEPLAANMLYERYGHLLFGIACKYFREDATLHTEKLFLSVVDQLKQYREETPFKDWIFDIAERYFQKTAGEKVFEVAAIKALPQDVVINDNSVMERFEVALSNMNEEQRTCVDLFYIRKKTIEEISSSTHIAADRIKQHLHNARMQISNSL